MNLSKNPIVKQMSSSATHMIRADHAAVMAKFHRLEPGIAPETRAALVRSICAALEIHAQIEEEIFYPALRQCGLDSPVLAHSVPEHDEMRRLIERVRSSETEGARLRRRPGSGRLDDEEIPGSATPSPLSATGAMPSTGSTPAGSSNPAGMSGGSSSTSSTGSGSSSTGGSGMSGSGTGSSGSSSMGSTGMGSTGTTGSGMSAAGGSGSTRGAGMSMSDEDGDLAGGSMGSGSTGSMGSGSSMGSSMGGDMADEEGRWPEPANEAVHALMSAVMHHVADEETQLLPAAERLMSRQQLAELGARMAERRYELARPRAGELMMDMARGAPAKTALVTVGALLAGSLLVGSLRRGGTHH